MKILMLVDNYPPEMNANARIFSELAENLAQKGIDISVITSHPNFPKGKIFPGYKNKWKSDSINNNVRVLRVKTYVHPNKAIFRRTLDFISFGISSFFFGSFERQHDIIVGVTPQFFCALSACFLSLLKRKPFILILCDLWPDVIVANNMMSKGLIYKITKKLEIFMYKRAATIAILSPYFRKYLIQNNIDDLKIIDFISGSSEDFYPREKNQYLLKKYCLTNKFVIGYIGTFGISHSHDDIITVLKSFKNSNVHFLMIGDGAKKDYLNKLITENKLDHITIDGPISAAEVPAYWSVCDVAIIPLAPAHTNKTVIPSKILEAMRMGLPVILYAPKGEATKFFSESRAIWHVEVGDVEGIKKLINRLSKKGVIEKKENAINFSEKFSREKQAQILLDNMHTIYKREKYYETT